MRIHFPLSDTAHISILVDGAPGRSACGQLSQLEVCQLLYSGGVVIYPGGLNGGLEPVWVTLPELPLWKAESTKEDIQLQITPQNHSRWPYGSHPYMVINTGFFPALHYRVSQWGSHWSQHNRGDRRTLVEPYVQNARGILHMQFPRRQLLRDIPDPTASKEENSPNPGEALLGYVKQALPSPHGCSQVDTDDIMAHSSHSSSHGTLDRGTSPTPFPLLANSVNLLDNVLHLQEKIKDTMVHLLSARTTIDMCHQWVISETEVGHHLNEINTSEGIREVKAWYAAVIGDAEAAYETAMRKVGAVHSASTSKVEVIQVTRIRKAKAANARQASKLQWQHQEVMPNLEEEALEVEKHNH